MSTKIDLTKRIDELLLKWLPDLIYDELKYMRKNEGGNISEEIQEFLGKDCHDEYFKYSPLMYRLQKIVDTLYIETPYEKYRD
jgi:hypothetical protein